MISHLHLKDRCSVLQKNRNIYGIGISFEELKTKVKITEANLGSTLTLLVNGNSTLRNDFITLSPYIGQRLNDLKISIDLLVGLDLGFCLLSKEEGRISPNPESLPNVDNNLQRPVLDLRPRAQIKLLYNRYGFICGYSLGLINYQEEANLKAYNRLLRVGLSYQLK